LYGHEDYELALRLVNAGVELGYSPEAVAYQRYDKDFAGLAADCVDRGHTAVLFARKHPGVTSGLKLTTYLEGSRKWRVARSLLLWLSTWLPRFPDWMIRWMTWLERRRPHRLHHYYTLALDFFFWVGARSALREPQPPDLPAASSLSGAEWHTGAAGASRTAVRMRIGLGLLLLFALGSSVRLLARAFDSFRDLRRPDEITRYEGRFQELRSALPRQARVGYVSGPVSQGPADGDDGPRLAFKRYLLTQYALVPVLVLPDVRGPLVVGNFGASAGIDSVAARGLTLIRDFGDGVMLFRTEAE
jgi:hypothetical protein